MICVALYNKQLHVYKSMIYKSRIWEVDIRGRWGYFWLLYIKSLAWNIVFSSPYYWCHSIFSNIPSCFAKPLSDDSSNTGSWTPFGEHTPNIPSFGLENNNLSLMQPSARSYLSLATVKTIIRNNLLQCFKLSEIKKSTFCVFISYHSVLE